MPSVAASALDLDDVLVLPDGDHPVHTVWQAPNTAYQAGESGPGLGYPSTYVTVTVAGIGTGRGGQHHTHSPSVTVGNHSLTC